MKKTMLALLLLLSPVNSWGMVVYYNPTGGKIFYAVPNDKAVNFSHSTNIDLSTLEIDERKLNASDKPISINLDLRQAIKSDIASYQFDIPRRYSIQGEQLYDNELLEVVNYDTNPEKTDMEGAVVQALTDLSTIIDNTETLTDAQVRDAIKKIAQHQKKIIKRLIQAK